MTDTTPDAHPLVPWLTPRRRAYLYRVATALASVAVALGVLGAGEASGVLALVSAVLAAPVAALHTPSRT